jgi:lipoprotein-anchoring transpeptidase ErfK/SrfK
MVFFMQTSSVTPTGQPRARRSALPWVFLLFWLVILGLVAALVLSLGTLYRGDIILAGVEGLGRDLGGRTRSEAANILGDEWDSRRIILDAGDQTWTFSPSQIGVILDSDAMAEAAYQQGRDEPTSADFVSTVRRFVASSGLLDAGVDPTAVAPVWHFDRTTAADTLRTLAAQILIPAEDAAITVVDGQVQTTPAVTGQALDIALLLAMLESHPWEAALARPQSAPLRFPMPVALQAPLVEEVSALVSEIAPLLEGDITIDLFDAVRNERHSWKARPADKGTWIAFAESGSADGGSKQLTWYLDRAKIAEFVSAQNASFGDERFVDPERLGPALSEVFENRAGRVKQLVQHGEREHVVKAGETLSSIAFDYGMPYPYLQQANSGLDLLLAGATIKIPSQDVLIPLEPLENKRVIISLTEQKMQAWENGDVKWDWQLSSGMDSSPTSPGVFQVQSHEEMAYAANWDLYMPWFMGIYRPVPNQAFMNGFHGFPSRDRRQLLWTKDLGRRVTYGCILLNTENAKLLYDWAENGVIVEIRK